MNENDKTRTTPSPAAGSVPATADTRTSPPGDPNATLVKPAGANAAGGLTIPGYDLLPEIARGGMGVVYRARDLAFDREVAIKVMLPGMSAAEFVREARITGRLPHPGIPPVHALRKLPDGRPFLAMKLIRGDTLDRVLKSRTDLGADRGKLLAAFEQMCHAVGYAHAQGIIHRDLKPSNVMVGAFGEVQVMDWGLAKEVHAAEPEAAAPGAPTAVSEYIAASVVGAVKWTPAYMAPAQARGELVDARADVFALGGILAAILTGKPPFAGNSVMDTIIRAAQADLRDTFTRLDECGADAELLALAKRCLAARAADRPATGAQLAEEVAAYRAELEERLRRAERERAAAEAKAEEQRKRRRVQFALAAAVLLLVGAGAGFAWWHDKQATERQLADERAAGEQLRLDGERKAAEARADAEAEFKGRQARQGIDANLTLAADLRKQYKFKEADAALAQAADLAKGGAPERVADVEHARRDLAFVVKLDDIRFRKWVWIGKEGGGGDFNTKIAPPEYRAAFAAFGLDLTVLAPIDAAGRVAASGVKADVVAAVDDWALYEPDVALRDRLLDVARRADPGPWTDRFRDPKVRADKSAVERLAVETDVKHVAPAALSALARLMRRRNLDSAPLLTAARAAYPGEFELAFSLGQRHGDSKEGMQIGSYEAARALRPDNTSVLINLGNALRAKGDADGAVAAYRRATELDPKFAMAHSNLGVALRAKGDADGAVAAHRRAIELDPKYALAHTILGAALGAKGDADGAIASYRRAIVLDPGHAPAHINLGVIYLQQRKYAECIACARAAIKADPKYSNAHAMLAEALLRIGDLAGARAALTEATRLDKRWAGSLAKLPPELSVAPPPREVPARLP